MHFSRETESVLRELLSILELADSPDPQDVLKRLDQLQRGLEPEHEISLILSWLGRCRLVHRLGQEQLPLASIEDFRVPDLLAAFEYSGRLVPALIEVKATASPNGGPRFTATLQIKPHQLRYAELLNLPLLVAWRNGGLWTLFDARRAALRTTNYRINFETAMKENLLGILAGDFSYRVVPGSAIRLVISKLGPVDQVTGGFDGVIRKAHFMNAGGETVPNIPHLTSLFLVWESEVVLEDQGDAVVQSFVVPESDTIEFASWTFSRIAHALAGITGETVNWRGIVHDAGHLAHDINRLRRLVDEGAKYGMVERMFIQRPATIPDFL